MRMRKFPIRHNKKSLNYKHTLITAYKKRWTQRRYWWPYWCFWCSGSCSGTSRCAFLYLLLLLSLYIHTLHSFQLTQKFPRAFSSLHFSNFQTQILVRAEKVQPGRREEAEEEDWREEEEDAADEERDAAAGVV